MRCRAVLGVLLLAGLARADDEPKGKQEAKTYETGKLNYLLYLPPNYDKATDKFPLILFLHGAGETGTKLDLVKKHGPPKLVAKKDFQFIIVSPQTPTRGWKPDVVIGLLDEVCSKYKVDKDRVYLTGLSMGGYGTWATAAAYPDRFAAIAPICGGSRNPEAIAKKLKGLPIWCFHGAKDRTVPLKQSEDLVKAVKEVGGNVKLTVYKDAGHDSWTQAYNDPELYKWFLSHKRKSAD